MYKNKKTMVLCLVVLLAINYLGFSIRNSSNIWGEKDDMIDLQSKPIWLNV